jgi:hypothetical protein
MWTFFMEVWLIHRIGARVILKIGLNTLWGVRGGKTGWMQMGGTPKNKKPSWNQEGIIIF